MLNNISDNLNKYNDRFLPKKSVDSVNNKYALAIFKEDVKLNNLKNSIQIQEVIEQSTKPQFQKLMYFYNVNSQDEYNAETKAIKQEVNEGIADPVRTAAIIEIQNFIKKNVGKKKLMVNIAEQSTKRMMVRSKNITFHVDPSNPNPSRFYKHQYLKMNGLN